MQAVITENRERIAELCRAHHVRRLSVFGSAVRDDCDPERSDIDLLVHNYDDLSHHQIWLVIQDSPPKLLSQVAALISKNPPTA